MGIFSSHIDTRDISISINKNIFEIKDIVNGGIEVIDKQFTELVHTFDINTTRVINEAEKWRKCTYNVIGFILFFLSIFIFSIIWAFVTDRQVANVTVLIGFIISSVIIVIYFLKVKAIGFFTDFLVLLTFIVWTVLKILNTQYNIENWFLTNVTLISLNLFISISFIISLFKKYPTNSFIIFLYRQIFHVKPISCIFVLLSFLTFEIFCILLKDVIKKLIIKLLPFFVLMIICFFENIYKNNNKSFLVHIHNLIWLISSTSFLTFFVLNDIIIFSKIVIFIPFWIICIFCIIPEICILIKTNEKLYISITILYFGNLVVCLFLSIIYVMELSNFFYFVCLFILQFFILISIIIHYYIVYGIKPEPKISPLLPKNPSITNKKDIFFISYKKRKMVIHT